MTARHSIDAAHLLARWREADLVAADDLRGVAEAIVAEAAHYDPPLYLKILSAVGTFLATAFFLAFLGVSGLISFDSGAGLIGWGVVFLGGAIALSFSLAKSASKEGLTGDLLAQTTFAALAVGKVLVVAGAIEQFGVSTPWVATTALATVTLVTYPVTGSSLDRLLSPYAVACAALFEILGRRSLGVDTDAALTIYFAVVTAVAGALLLSHRVPVALRPIGLAALGAMGSVVAIVAAGHDAALSMARQVLDPRPIEAILVVALVGVIAWAAGGLDRLARPPVAAAAVGVVALGFAGAPGVIFALLLLLLGHARHDVPMRVVGILALPGFLVLWYYGRDLTFLAKSAALVGSGLLLLAARAGMAFLGWDREDAA